jgi:hypothetical protein
MSLTPDTDTEREHAERLPIALRLFQALIAQDPDRVIILMDGGGRMVARHDLRLEQSDPRATYGSA